jgi:16S rRNA (guanine(1405)-N(7))-methyltransferase
MDEQGEQSLEQLVATVRSSAKYKAVCEDLISNIGAREIARRRSLKAAVKSTKNKLHQIAGAYFAGKPRYERWREELETVRRAGGEREMREACVRMMAFHASTSERLPILSKFYPTVFDALPPVRSVLDLGCGLNPLALPWMGLPENVTYHACDIYDDLAGFLTGFFRAMGVDGRATACDLTRHRFRRKVDLALILKVFPCLEQIDKSAALSLLDRVNAAHLLVSFPVSSLSGRDKGMADNYRARFLDLAGDRSWKVKRFRFASELAFLVTK